MFLLATLMTSAVFTNVVLPLAMTAGTMAVSIAISNKQQEKYYQRSLSDAKRQSAEQWAQTEAYAVKQENIYRGRKFGTSNNRGGR